MTTFTSDDREEAYKKIVAEAPNQPGYEDAVPIPEDIKALEKGLEFFKVLKGNNASPPHVVDSGASVMGMTANELVHKLETAKSISEVARLVKEEVIPMLDHQQAEISLLREYVCQLENGLDSSIKLNKAQAERVQEK
jgi:hypothetical protein